MVVVMITSKNVGSDQSTNFDSVCIPVKTSTKVVTFSDEEAIEFDSLEYDEDDWKDEVVASTETTTSSCLDLCNSGLQTIPEVVLQSIDDVKELLAGQNKLQEIGLKALSQFPQLQVLRLPRNGFTKFPSPVLLISGLKVLDLSDNSIETIPAGISQLIQLEEFHINRNVVQRIPETVQYLRNIKILQFSNNKLTEIPEFLREKHNMNITIDQNDSSNDKLLNNLKVKSSEINNLNSPLNKLSLRTNNLKGNIILGSYSNLTHLDISENEIECLNLKNLDKLETLQCCRNQLKELVVNGNYLTSLIADHNELKKITIEPHPTRLRHLDVSHNDLEVLPTWLSGCFDLRSLIANHNNLSVLPEYLFSRERSYLHTLRVSYNKLKKLPLLSSKTMSLKEMYLQCNLLEDLPDNFFVTFENVSVLNISSNKLKTFPKPNSQLSIEKLYATKNLLTDQILNSLKNFSNIRIFHCAYNFLTSFPETIIYSWKCLEEINLSGNNLRHLPANLPALNYLRILRVHSNELQTTPALSTMSTLRVLDLAHNQLDRINLTALVPKTLQFLDLSCNLQLQVDPNQLKVYQSQRAISLVDVSGKNRLSLPTSSDAFNEQCNFEPPWKIGFSETSGKSSKLYISQLRLPHFCNTEGLFGLFDGELNSTNPKNLIKSIPKTLLEERTIKETANEYLKYTLLSTHRDLKESGQKLGLNAMLCHITREKVLTEIKNDMEIKKFVLRVAAIGETGAYLVRKSGTVPLISQRSNVPINNTAFPLLILEPEIFEVYLDDSDEFVVIANKKLWEFMNINLVTREVRSEENVVLAAKKIQDIAQSFGADENLSIIIIKFANLGSDVDLLMRELRQAVQKKPSTVISGFCKCGCCCDTSNSCCHSAQMFTRQFSNRSARSSPSGQSDKHYGELNYKSGKTSELGSTIASRRSTNSRVAESNIARAIRAKIVEEEREETDSALSEEQFKCWEYMLEQNTQLLFDKELNTISKSFTKNKNASISNLNMSSNLMRSSNSRPLSASSPQLLFSDLNKPMMPTPSYMTKQFGSSRGMLTSQPALLKSMKMHSTGKIPLTGGPNAAYFGSLQRLMPYNLEYDFAIMRERLNDDDIEHENRMRQYWGVATTEL
ncbi:PHLPP2 family protein [Megaselia abdita]